MSLCQIEISTYEKSMGNVLIEKFEEEKTYPLSVGFGQKQGFKG